MLILSAMMIELAPIKHRYSAFLCGGELKYEPKNIISLKSNDTYAVYNQIRTVNANRFIALKEDITKIQVEVEEELYIKLFKLAITDMLYSCNQDIKIKIAKSVYEQESIIKAKKPSI